MEGLHSSGRVKSLGVSNIQYTQLVDLCKFALVKPNFVQNRCYASTKWDRQVREYCKTQDISYQAFSLLTANRQIVAGPFVRAVAEKYAKTIPQVVFKFSQQIGMIVLTGTTDLEHMKEDLDLGGFKLTTQELETTVQIKSGTTVVIGGLIQDRQEKQSSKVPMIGSVPLLGRAFQSKAHDFTKTELVTFLTPTIIRPTEATQEESRFFDPERKMLPFEVFGDYPYRTTSANPGRLAAFGEIPYWENQDADRRT